MEEGTQARDKRTNKVKAPSSFRDPSGFIFRVNGHILRQINCVYRENYEKLMTGGLYSELTEKGLMVTHKEVDITNAVTEEAFKIIEPEPIDFISYPYEWCFSQLKDAALLTLECQKIAMKYGMSLRDCSAYNAQFHSGSPVLIDTLSFEQYKEGEPWVAYRQFCQHFLAPLALMSYRDVRLNQLLKIYIDGIPLDLAAALLPPRTRFKLSIYLHVHLHAKAQKKYADRTIKDGKKKIGKLSFLGLIDSLEQAVRKANLKDLDTQWGDYYVNASYSDLSFERKRSIVSGFLDEIKPKSVWDIGANTGVFSRIAAEKNIHTVSFDVDPLAVEKNYIQARGAGEKNILPLLLDITNPSPGIGWENRERSSFIERSPVDMIMALALVHHLAITCNLPFDKIAEFFSRMCNNLICEFVPKGDSQVQRLLAFREDIFANYTENGFEGGFRPYFEIKEKIVIEGSERILYLLSSKC